MRRSLIKQMSTRAANSLFVYADKFTTYCVQNVRLRMVCMLSLVHATRSILMLSSLFIAVPKV